VAALTGIRVIEMASILAGPWAGQLFADLGADVIKVEKPGSGDETRRWGPPFIAGANGERLEAAYFHACNRGKRSVEIDITDAEGRAALVDLIAGADVLIENFRVGALARYGLGHEALIEINPRLVHCSITGFGQDGPYAERPGYDAMIQGLSGLMDITGTPDGAPQKVGVAFADVFTGLYAVIAIQAAMAERSRTNKGTHIDMALLDSLVGVLANQALNFFVTGVAPKRMGNAHPNLVPYQAFAVRDGHVVIAVGSDAQFAKMCHALDLVGLAEDPKFATNEARVNNRDDLIPRIETAIAGRARTDVIAALEAAGVPAGPINSIADTFGDPQVIHRAMRIDLPDAAAAAGAVPGLRAPIRFDGKAPCASQAAPRLGEHNQEILGNSRAGKGR
jgi:crotonobetainyl-CoA:carnitine CoA-transferase CaiB-like acyl-CoA transferase